ncbi:MAG TPA: DUF2059 domain-containing protein [Terriglobia bacterium]|nr:DUF2059 domain-containing protein [Terriglobia bacterium]
MKQRIVTTVALLSLCVPALRGQQSEPASDAASREDVRKLMEVMQVRSQMQHMIDQMSQQARTVGREQVRSRYPNFPEETLAKLEALQEQMYKEMPIDGMLEDIVPVYQRHFSKADVNAMIAFYSTPTGKKLLQAMPSLASESMQAGSARMQSHMQSYAQKAQTLIQELRQQQPAPSSPR